MEIGYFTMPSHPPECGLKEGHDWDLQVMRWLDELGYQEAWIGEHHTAPWEPHPSPDLLVAQALFFKARFQPCLQQYRVDRLGKIIIHPRLGTE